MKKRTTEILIWLLAVLPVVLTTALYTHLPAQVPVHWDLDGTVRYGGKGTIWLLALLPVVVTALMRVLPKVDPRRKNYSRFQGYYDGAVLAMVLFFLGVFVVTLIESLRPGTVSVGRTVTVGVGLLFLFLGNMMPKVKNNFFLGFRTPWTLSDPDVWNRTHRLGGILFFVLGVVLVPCGAFLPEPVTFVILLAGALATGAIPMIFSYIWYRQTVDKGRER